MWKKQCVSTVMESPVAKLVERWIDEIDAPTPTPAAAPHTMNTYKNDAKHSDIIALQNFENENYVNCNSPKKQKEAKLLTEYIKRKKLWIFVK